MARQLEKAVIAGVKAEDQRIVTVEPIAVVAGATVDQVCAAVADKKIGGVAAVERIVAGPAVQSVLAAEPMNPVVIGAGFCRGNRFRAVGADHRFGAGPAQYGRTAVGEA